VPLTQRGQDGYRERNTAAMLRDLMEELLPLVESNYHVATDPQRRAIAGLSMGGGHAITIGMSQPDLFGAIGAFSSGGPEGDLADGYPSWLPANNPAQSQRRLFWIACGKEDFLLQRNRRFNDQLNQAGITHTYVETEGDHSWPVWRDYLPRFLKELGNAESR
jgi:enterochelin esterase family protein